MSKETKLKPCPFCGGKVHTVDIGDGENYFMVQCENKKCGASACFGVNSETLDDVREFWNRRANDE